jgi:hypothetical protein
MFLILYKLKLNNNILNPNNNYLITIIITIIIDYYNNW